MPCHAKNFRTKEHKKAVVGHSKDLWHLPSRSYFGVPYRSTCRWPSLGTRRSKLYPSRFGWVAKL